MACNFLLSTQNKVFKNVNQISLNSELTNHNEININFYIGLLPAQQTARILIRK
jgi:hypothetical protein